MAHGIHAVYVVTMTSGATLSSGFDLGRTYTKVYLQIPTMASGDVFVHAAVSATATYNRITQNDPNQGTDFKIASSVTQRVVPIPHGHRFMKIENSSGATDVVTTFRVICSD